MCLPPEAERGPLGRKSTASLCPQDLGRAGPALCAVATAWAHQGVSPLLPWAGPTGCCGNSPLPSRRWVPVPHHTFLSRCLQCESALDYDFSKLV